MVEIDNVKMVKVIKIVKLILNIILSALTIAYIILCFISDFKLPFRHPNLTFEPYTNFNRLCDIQTKCDNSLISTKDYFKENKYIITGQIKVESVHEGSNGLYIIETTQINSYGDKSKFHDERYDGYRKIALNTSNEKAKILLSGDKIKITGTVYDINNTYLIISGDFE